jgi:DNA polymerase III delta prime subunit
MIFSLLVGHSGWSSTDDSPTKARRKRSPKGADVTACQKALEDRVQGNIDSDIKMVLEQNYVLMKKIQSARAVIKAKHPSFSDFIDSFFNHVISIKLGTKPIPVAFHLLGPPGIGKTTILTEIISELKSHDIEMGYSPIMPTPETSGAAPDVTQLLNLHDKANPGKLNIVVFDEIQNYIDELSLKKELPNSSNETNDKVSNLPQEEQINASLRRDRQFKKKIFINLLWSILGTGQVSGKDRAMVPRLMEALRNLNGTSEKRQYLDYRAFFDGSKPESEMTEAELKQYEIYRKSFPQVTAAYKRKIREFMVYEYIKFSFDQWPELGQELVREINKKIEFDEADLQVKSNPFVYHRPEDFFDLLTNDTVFLLRSFQELSSNLTESSNSLTFHNLIIVFVGNPNNIIDLTLATLGQGVLEPNQVHDTGKNLASFERIVEFYKFIFGDINQALLSRLGLRLTQYIPHFNQKQWEALVLNYQNSINGSVNSIIEKLTGQRVQNIHFDPSFVAFLHRYIVNPLGNPREFFNQLNRTLPAFDQMLAFTVKSALDQHSGLKKVNSLIVYFTPDSTDIVIEARAGDKALARNVIEVNALVKPFKQLPKADQEAIIVRTSAQLVAGMYLFRSPPKEIQLQSDFNVAQIWNQPTAPSQLVNFRFALSMLAGELANLKLNREAYYNEIPSSAETQKAVMSILKRIVTSMKETADIAQIQWNDNLLENESMGFNVSSPVSSDILYAMMSDTPEGYKLAYRRLYQEVDKIIDVNHNLLVTFARELEKNPVLSTEKVKAILQEYAAIHDRPEKPKHWLGRLASKLGVSDESYEKTHRFLQPILEPFLSMERSKYLLRPDDVDGQIGEIQRSIPLAYILRQARPPSDLEKFLLNLENYYRKTVSNQ